MEEGAFSKSTVSVWAVFRTGFMGFSDITKKGNIWGERYEFQSSNKWMDIWTWTTLMHGLFETYFVNNALLFQQTNVFWLTMLDYASEPWAGLNPAQLGYVGLTVNRRDGTKRASWSHVAKTYNKAECHPWPCSTTKCIVRWWTSHWSHDVMLTLRFVSSGQSEK